VLHPLGVPDFASYLLQAQSSKAQVVALANSGADVVNAIKQAREFGIVEGGQRHAPLLMFLSDLPPVGLVTGQGLTYDGGFHWMFDVYSQSIGGVRAMVNKGGKSWFFITVDYAFGHSLQKGSEEMVKKLDGTVAGAVLHPLGVPDFASYLLQAQSSKAQVVALANSGADVVNAIKQAREFGIVEGGQRLASLLIFLSDLRALGLENGQGLTYVDGFYWDFDDNSRKWSDRFAQAFNGLKPTMTHAGVYSSVLHYLKAVAATQSTDGKVVADKMREIPINDPVMHNASIRPDGRVIHDMYLYEAKKPSESTGDWDLSKLVATIPAEEAFQPLSESTCSLVKKS